MSLFVLWLLWSGTYTVDLGVLMHASDAADSAHAGGGEGEHAAVNVQILILGLLSCVGVALLCHRMGIVDRETIPVHLLLPVVAYLPWLASRVVKSTVAVIRRILFPVPDDRPETVIVKGSQHSDIGLVTLANSITLTPGTVTVQVDGNTFIVHALMRDTADSVYRGRMDRRVARIDRWHVKEKS